MIAFSDKDIEKIQKTESGDELEEFLKDKNIKLRTQVSFLKQTYQYCTINNFSCQQKQLLLNLAYQIIKKISQGFSEKAKLKEFIDIKIKQLSHKNQEFKRLFSEIQAFQIYELLKKNLLPYYQIFEIVLDKHPHFNIQTSTYDPIPVTDQSPMDKGTIVDVENIPILKNFIGIRQAKEEKKDPKKK